MKELTNREGNTKITKYTHFLVMPLKFVGCWEWFPNSQKEYQIILNNIYLALVLFVLINLPLTLIVNLYTEWVDVMGSLEKIADGLPLLVAIAVVAYFSVYKQEMYELIQFMDKNFKYNSARGLTNMNMFKSYKTAKNFAYTYTACTLFSITMYVTIPVIVHLWTKQPLQPWIYMDVSRKPTFVITFLRQALGQVFVGLAVGQLGVFFAANAILLCGQLDLICCSLRNAKYTALLRSGISYAVLKEQYGSIVDDEIHNYIYSDSKLEDSDYHYNNLVRKPTVTRTQYDIYSPEFEANSISALRECARAYQVARLYKDKFEKFVSPMLVLRVVQVTLYLCTLLYAATAKFDMITVEYLGAVALDIFVYCYFGNQIILQADRVSLSAYQSAWASTGMRARRVLLHILLSSKRAVCVRAGRFLIMDLHTFIVIIKTSFSYYTLLVNVQEKK